MWFRPPNLKFQLLRSLANGVIKSLTFLRQSLLQHALWKCEECLELEEELEVSFEGGRLDNSQENICLLLA